MLDTVLDFAQANSILSRSALDDFARDLYDRLLAVRPDGHFDDVVSFAGSPPSCLTRRPRR